jgi:hypothetical protein
MKKANSVLPLAAAVSLAMIGGLGALSAPVSAADQFSERGIVGTVAIDYDSRKHKASDGQPEPGFNDKLAVDLNVGKDTAFKGSIVRTPQVAGNLGIKQSANMRFDVDLVVFNPANRAQTMSVGRWVGDIPVGSDGVYQLNKDKGASVRFAITQKGGAPAGDFGGIIRGRKLGSSKLMELANQVKDSVKKEGVSKVFTRMYQGKPLSVKATNVDPMGFENLVLAAGPASMYSPVTVNGNMFFDYDSDTWFLENMSFRYQDKDKQINDRVSGTIRWIDNKDRTGGRYELNVTFNEPVTTAAPADASGFFAASDDSASGFFAVDNSLATCGGKVNFADEYSPGSDSPLRSKVEHKIECNDKVTPHQVMAFSKLWLLGIGPITDE